MSIGYEAELHSQAGRARRRGSVPERCPAPQFSQSRGGTRGDAIGDQPGGARTRGARRRSALHPHDAQCRLDRSRRAISLARKARFRRARRRKRDRARPRTSANRTVAPHGAARGRADPAGAAVASFCQAYPEIEVEIAANEELVDLAAKGFDAGIRMGQFIAADMVAVRLTPPFPFVVVGSPEYLAGVKGPSASTICVSMPACDYGARTGRSRLVLCRWKQDNRGDRLGAADRLRLPHHAWRGHRRHGACASA